MVSRENDDSQEFPVFKQPLKKQARFIHPSKEEQILALSKGFVPVNTRKNTTWPYNVFSDWLAERNNNAKKVSKKFVLSTCISKVWLLPVLCLLCVYVYIAYCCCLRGYFLFLLSSTAFINRLLSAVLTNCKSSVANRALNDVLARLSALLPITRQVLLLPIVRLVLLLPLAFLVTIFTVTSTSGEI